MEKVKGGKGGKTINTINVSFGNTEWRTLQKEKGKQSWRTFILERAAINSNNEIHNKGITDKGLCERWLHHICENFNNEFGTRKDWLRYKRGEEPDYE